MIWDVIAFDLDNTLYNHEYAFKRAIRSCYKSMQQMWHEKKESVHNVAFETWFTTYKYYSDQLWPDYENKRINGQTYRRSRYLQAMAEHKLPRNKKEADAFHAQYYDTVHLFIQPDPILHELLSWLIGDGVRMGILSNGATKTQKNKIKQLEIEQFFTPSAVLVSEEVQIEKPDPRLFQLLDHRLQTDGLKKLFIGDSWEQDMIGATAAGWDALYVNTRNQRPSSNLKVVATVDSLASCYNWLMSNGRIRG
ncbi:HAD family hydrolase [Bacillus sp. FJAT-45037]|uniref:HAD family hydrolase n=1 Tax=Bacillus sp. FJAT-45037 TaxID=2011007 RepID=UPI0012FD17B5|nr:HAD family hydrolase [Bacillus sp. FJAT-45037]